MEENRMKRTVFLFMALLVGIVLPLQTAQSRVDPATEIWDGDAGEDHPWGGDLTDPGGLHMKPASDGGYIRMSFIGQVVGYTMPIILRFYTKRQVSLSPTIQRTSSVAPATPTLTKTFRLTEGK
jgi:hypothetical protein